MNTTDPTKLINVQIDGINTWDSPDFVDAYLSYACYPDGTELTDSELDAITENNPDWIYDQVMSELY